jgi:ribosomal protein S18 acetylase RimI-like enzyme
VLGTAAVGDLQERAARAVPAAVQEVREGCWLRHTDSTTTWWAGAALVHGVVGDADLTTTIAAAEDFYAGHGSPARFQVCPACPPGLDAALSRRGYACSDDVSLQVATTGQVAQLAAPPGSATRLRVEVAEDLDVEWFRLLVAAQEPAGDPAPEWRLLQRVDQQSAYATATLAGRPVAVGRAVADTGSAGVFSMATLPDARRLGAGRAVLTSLAEWAEAAGAQRMYLQVTDESSAAVRLYRRAGFRVAGTYHYRDRRTVTSSPTSSASAFRTASLKGTM